MRLVILVCLAILIGGCSTAGYKQAPHNGKFYWFPDECGDEYRYNTSSTDLVYCVDENGQTNGIVLAPATPEELYFYQEQQRLQAQNWQNLMSTINQNNANMAQRNYEQSYNNAFYRNEFERLNQNGLNKIANPTGWGYYR